MKALFAGSRGRAGGNFCFSTPLFIQSVAMFCYGCCKGLRGPAWAVGSYSSGPPAGGIPESSSLKLCDILDEYPCRTTFHP